MKKGMKKHKTKGQIKWRILEWSHSIYPSCLKWLIASFILVIFVNYGNQIDTRLESILTSIYTGIIASVFVTVFIQKKQDTIILNRKKAMLFDAFFLLNDFVKKCSNLKKENSINWIHKYEISEEVASYLSDLYSFHMDIFDVIELNYLRSINSNLFFIKRILNVDDDERQEFMKCDEKVFEIDKKYNDCINELIENLYYLIIKWNSDGITNIEIK